MLREITATRQIEGEPRRRWFTSDSMDLTIWYAQDDTMTGFQLCYDKGHAEHALGWDQQRGFSHHAVDDGEDARTLCKASPILIADGPPPWEKLRNAFLTAASQLDDTLSSQILHAMDEYRIQTDGTNNPGSGYLHWIQTLNQHDLSNFLPFHINHNQVGWLRNSFSSKLTQWPHVFTVDADGAQLNSALASFSERSAALKGVAQDMADQGISSRMLNEAYPVVSSNRLQPLCLIDRSIVAQFGVKAYSQHMNGFVRKPDGLHIWVARRAQDRINWPGKLDQMVAGGLPYGITLGTNLRKECHEEAGIPAALADRARAVGAIAYVTETQRGLRRDTMFCYDLELSSSFVPHCTDDEVDSFQLMPVEQVADRVLHSDDFKPNCNLVIIDFLIRHGIIDPEHPDYLELVNGLHQPEPHT